MMRKDVKVGFVIGGILVAVLVAVAIVSGPKKAPPNGAELASADPTSTDQSNNATGERLPSPADASAARSAEGPAPRAPDQKPGDPFTPGAGSTSIARNEPTAEDKWMLALNNGIAPMMTTTPGPSNVGASNSGTTSLVADAGLVAKPITDPATQPANITPPNISPAGMFAATTALPQPLPAPAPSAPRTHIVQANETFSTIAAAAYGNPNFYPHIQRANPNVDPKKLRPGMTLVLPPVTDVKGPIGARVETNTPASLTRTPEIDPKTQYLVERNDSLQKISIKLYGTSTKWESIYTLNKDKIGPDPAKLKLHSVLKLPAPPTVH